MEKEMKSKNVFCGRMFTPAVLVMFFACLLIGCNQVKTEKTSFDDCPSREDMTQMIIEATKESFFDGEVMEVRTGVVQGAYGIEQTNEEFDVIGCVMSTGAKADELTIIWCKDLKSGEKLAKDYLNKRKDMFAGYAPAEAEKIEKAKVISCGGNQGICIVAVAKDIDKIYEFIQAYIK